MINRIKTLPEHFIVTEIKCGKITVSSCKTEGQSNQHALNIEVTNRSNFKIEKGSIVCIGFPKKYELIQGILSLLFPILFGLAGMFFAPHILEIFKIKCTEEMKFCITTVFFLIVAIIIRLINRSPYTVIKPSITAIIEKDKTQR